MRRPASPLPAVTSMLSATSAMTSQITAHEHGSSTSRDTQETAASNAGIPNATAIEAKLVVLGAQGVGKTSLVKRLVDPLEPLPASIPATIGASFITKKIYDQDTNTTVRLQIWDTAGQERFRSMSKLYYRGAHAGLICYDVTSEQSFEEMKDWLREMKENCDLRLAHSAEPFGGMVVHVVGTKTDLVASDPSARRVPLEKTISYVAEQLGGLSLNATAPMIPLNSSPFYPPSSAAATTTCPPLHTNLGSSGRHQRSEAESKRSSGFWNPDLGWDFCHEVSARDNDGIEEVFRVIARKLVEQRNLREARKTSDMALDGSSGAGQYFSVGNRRGRSRSERELDAVGNDSFRLGHAQGERRKSWLGLPTIGFGGDGDRDVGLSLGVIPLDEEEARRQGRCC